MIISKLKIINNQIRELIPIPHKLIDNHYALITNNNKAVIFTSRPLKHPHPKSYFISNTNIEGKNEPQYLSGYVYNLDPKITIAEISEKGMNYLSKEKNQILNATDLIDFNKTIDLIQYISENV